MYPHHHQRQAHSFMHPAYGQNPYGGLPNLGMDPFQQQLPPQEQVHQMMPYSQMPSQSYYSNPYFDNPLQSKEYNPYQAYASQQGYANPYPKAKFMAKPSSGGMGGMLNSFKSQDGKFDLNKMMNTGSQMMGAINQVSSLVKGFGAFLK
ncbi:YppG family protein [Rossellomorea marisflavi]|uniref:YppG family protein n=1 Tax=Rossellomorea marisflavi TaxID=189381 RepID=UPI00069D231A|nr:YppG family protein [Rossellomorea marisflavi]MCM2604970.1 YppG family protein [Rossellomorea marisflavi]